MSKSVSFVTIGLLHVKRRMSKVSILQSVTVKEMSSWTCQISRIAHQSNVIYFNKDTYFREMSTIFRKLQ